MTRDDIIRMAREAGLAYKSGRCDDWIDAGPSGEELIEFAALVAAAEREAIAKMFDEPMHLVPFVQNHEGGCMVCGFTPKLAAKSIRARGQA